MIVHFTVAEEFIEELKLDATRVSHGIVRSCIQYTTTDSHRVVHVLASYAINGRLVRLRCRIAGTPFWDMEAKRINAAADQVQKLVTDAVAALKLELRAGVYRDPREEGDGQ